jgi:hypothetical protein
MKDSREGGVTSGNQHERYSMYATIDVRFEFSLDDDRPLPNSSAEPFTDRL